MEYGYAADQVSILFEKKAHMKARGLASLDDADALALTFAEPVQTRESLYWPEPRRRGNLDEMTDEEIHAWTYREVNDPSFGYYYRL